MRHRRSAPRTKRPSIEYFMNLKRNMVLITPSANSLIVEAPTPAAIVDSINELGTVASASCASPAASAGSDSAVPRRASFTLSLSRARARRLESVPSEIPSAAAACARDRPWRSQSKIGPRSRSGNRAMALSSNGSQSTGSGESGANGSRIKSRSRESCRARRIRALFATRTATP